MAAEYMHIGIPVLNRKEGMVYNETSHMRLAFVIWDDAIIELYEEK